MSAYEAYLAAGVEAHDAEVRGDVPDHERADFWDQVDDAVDRMEWE